MTSKKKSAPAERIPNFEELGLDELLLEQVKEMGFEKPTPIQAQAMPPLLMGADIIGRARTGSGKTAAFGLPLLDHLKEGGSHVRALVLTPTRELANQIGEALREHATRLPKVHGVTIYGGAPYGPQIKALKQGANIVVGTPGRVIDLLERGALDLSRLEMFVLDEADEMLRMGFIEDVERLLAETPEDRQVALFSATMPPQIRKVARKYIPDAVEVQVEESALTVDHIDQQWLVIPHRHKLAALERLLKVNAGGSTLVFARTRVSCSEITEELTRKGYAIDTLHGDISQPARERVMRRMRSGQLKLVVATDVAARGLDVDHLTLVVNLDIPESKEVYVHRIGRTGRAGRKGTAISLVTPVQQRFIWRLEKDLNTKIRQIQVPSDAEIAMLQRSAFSEKLSESTVPNAQTFSWLRDLMQQHDWTIEEAAARALALLAERDGISLSSDKEFDTSPPDWAQVRGQRPGGDRGVRRNRNRPSQHKKFGKGRPSRRGRKKFDRTEKNEGGPKFTKSKKAKKRFRGAS